jgi:hypothetical protein
VPHVAREIDDGHPTTSDLALDLVAAAEADHRVWIVIVPSMRQRTEFRAITSR